MRQVMNNIIQLTINENLIMIIKVINDDVNTKIMMKLFI